MASLLAANALENFEELGASDDDSESDDGSPRCRICYETGGVLLRPCACDGSMAFVHGACLGRWLAAQAPTGVSRTCDVCRSPWRVVSEPTVGRFLRSLVFGGRGADAVARLLRHVSEPRHVRVHWEGDDDDDDDDDDDFDDDDGDDNDDDDDDGDFE